jgi:hypothetical protein
MLVLHAAESGNDVSTCVVGGCSQYSQSVIILRTAFCVWEGCCSGRWRQRAGKCRAGSGGGGGGVMAKIYDGLWSFDRRADFVAFSKFLSVQSASPNCRRGSRSVCACRHQRRAWRLERSVQCVAGTIREGTGRDETAGGCPTCAMGRCAECGRHVVDGEMARWLGASHVRCGCVGKHLYIVRPHRRCNTRVDLHSSSAECAFCRTHAHVDVSLCSVRPIHSVLKTSLSTCTLARSLRRL